MKNVRRALPFAALAALVCAPAALAASASYQNTITAAAPILYYKLNEATGTTVINYGTLGASHNGTYNGTVGLGTATQSGDTGVTFDAAEDFIESLGAAPVGLTGNPSFTIEAIVRIPQGATASLWPTFLHWGTGGTGHEVYFSLQHDQNNKVYAGFYNGGLRTIGTIALDTWHHIVMVRTGGGAAQVGTTLFVDGVKPAVEPDTDLCCNGTTPTVTATTFRINRGRDFTRFFTGAMDELVLFDHALNDAEVQAHYVQFAGTATPTPTQTPTNTPTPAPTSAPENCENCIDDDGDTLIDRNDPDCAPPANGAGAGIAGVAATKALDKCSKVLQKAGTKLATTRFKLASACLKAAATCVQTKSGDATCPPAASAACTKALGKLPAAETALDATVLKVCSAPGVSASDLVETAGIGFSGETAPCSRRGVASLSGIADVSQCVRRQHACAVDRLLTAAVPRAAELLTLGGRNVAVEFPCLVDGGTGAGAGVEEAKRKALRKCDDTLQKATQKLLGAKLKTVQSCTGPVFTCLQVKGGDLSCLAKAEPKCAKAIGKLPSLDAALAAAVAKSCSVAPLEISDLTALPGLGFSALAGLCSALDVPSLTSLNDLTLCVTRQMRCRADQMLENQTPRSHELVSAGGQPLP